MKGDAREKQGMGFRFVHALIRSHLRFERIRRARVAAAEASHPGPALYLAHLGLATGRVRWIQAPFQPCRLLPLTRANVRGQRRAQRAERARVGATDVMG